jgi:hypothetical protein
MSSSNLTAHRFSMSPQLPFDRSYWAAPGRLLAGVYPGDSELAEGQRKLTGLIRCGVGLVVNLMQPNEVNRNGKPFVDYCPTLAALAKQEGRVIRVERLPILDCDVPTVAHMQKILDAIDEANAGGQIVYVHCWGGKGRTGTVIGCYLARHALAVGEAALQRLNDLTRAAPYDFGYVPQTDAQCDFVRNWRPQR